MSIEEVRTTIADVLHALNATDQVKPSRLAAFEAGDEDIRLVELALGSLARMELLVALEMEHGAAISPQELSQLESLGDIVQRVDASAVPVATQQPRSEPSASHTPASPPDEPVPPIVATARREIGECRGTVQLHKALSDLMYRLTPVDVGTLGRWHQRGDIVGSKAPPDFGAVFSTWLDELIAPMQSSGKTQPEPFTFNPVAAAAVHFTGPGERASKTLLICFSTVGGRQMWMPNPVLLQHTDARRFDLLVISDAERTGFRRGVPQMGQSVTEVVRWVADLDLVGEYGSLRTFGCSAGAYPALLTALHLDAELGVSVSGRFPRTHLRHLGQIIRTYLNTWNAARRSTSARVLMVHCNGVRDTRFARRLAWIAGANRLCVEIGGRTLKHNIVKPFIERGELERFLDRTVFARVDSELFATRGTTAKLRFPSEKTTAPPQLSLDP